MILYVVQTRKAIAPATSRLSASAVFVIELQRLGVCAPDRIVFIVPSALGIRATPAEHLYVF